MKNYVLIQCVLFFISINYIQAYGNNNRQSSFQSFSQTTGGDDDSYYPSENTEDSKDVEDLRKELTEMRERFSYSRRTCKTGKPDKLGDITETFKIEIPDQNVNDWLNSPRNATIENFEYNTTLEDIGANYTWLLQIERNDGYVLLRIHLENSSGPEAYGRVNFLLQFSNSTIPVVANTPWWKFAAEEESNYFGVVPLETLRQYLSQGEDIFTIVLQHTIAGEESLVYQKYMEEIPTQTVTKALLIKLDDNANAGNISEILEKSTIYFTFGKSVWSASVHLVGNSTDSEDEQELIVKLTLWHSQSYGILAKAKVISWSTSILPIISETNLYEFEFSSDSVVKPLQNDFLKILHAKNETISIAIEFNIFGAGAQICNLPLV